MTRALFYSFVLASVCNIAIAQENVWKDSLVLEEIIVPGTRPALSRAATPGAVSVITRDMIENSGESAVLTLLPAYVPGLFVTERGTTGYGVYSGSAGAVSLRGVGASPTTQVLVTIDGQPQFMGINGHHLPDAYRASDAERIEVIRGPASTVYGSNAMGGVINIVTRKPQEGVKTQADISYGSYNTQKYTASNSVRIKKFSSFVSVGHDRTDGSRPYSDFHLTSGDLKLGYEFSEHFKMTGSAGITKYVSTDPGTVDKPAVNDTMTADILRLSTLLSIENKYEKTNGSLNLFYNYGVHDLYYGWHSKDHNFGASVYQSLRLFRGNVITAGIDYKRYGGRATDRSKPKFSLDRYIDETAGYLLVEQTLLKKLVLNAGIRLDHNSRFGNEYVPQGGITYRASRTSTVKVSVAKGFRSPTLRELYIFAANDSLRPERMVNYELSYLYTSRNGKLQAEIAAYISKGNNIIETQFINGVPKHSSNSGSFTNKGFELSANYRIIKNLTVAANYSYVHMSKPILAAPRQQLNLRCGYGVGRFGIEADMQYIEGLYTRTGKMPEQNNFTLLNAGIDFKALKWMQLYVKVKNILDSSYQMNYGYPMPGITAYGGIRISI